MNCFGYALYRVKNMQLHWLQAAALVAIASSMFGQNLQRRASIIGGGGDRGKCTIEVVVDSIAEVEIRGDMGTLHDLAGQQPQWRRFECTAPLPPNPLNFRFSGVDGRGRQTLVREPGNGGAAVVRIEDPQGGQEGYTFDLTWGGGGSPGGFRPDDRRPDDRRPAGDRGFNRAFSTDQAVQVCQDAIRQQAVQRFRTPEIAFRRTMIDDNPGRNDWVIGSFAIRRGFNREEEYRFSCSVNFENGRVRSAQIEPLAGDRPGDRPIDRPNDRSPFQSGPGQAAQACQRAVEDKIRNEGYDRVNFGSVRVDDRPGRNDRITGTARADGRNGSDSFDFACRVDLQTGAIRSVDAILR